MGNHSSGSLARTLLLYGIVALVVFFALRVLIGIIFGALSMLFTLVLLGLVAYAVIWLVRKL
jgi:hypothetical protein